MNEVTKEKIIQKAIEAGYKESIIRKEFDFIIQVAQNIGYKNIYTTENICSRYCVLFAKFGRYRIRCQTDHEVKKFYNRELRYYYISEDNKATLTLEYNFKTLSEVKRHIRELNEIKARLQLKD